MSGRRLLASSGVLLLLAIAACRQTPATEAPPPDVDGRARVLAFWQRFHAATERRTSRDYAAAVPLYLRALELDPRHEDSLYYLGQSLRELGRAGEARRAFEGLLAVNPASARGHMGLGALLASPDPGEPLDLATAESCFRRAHDLNREETGPMVRLAEVLIVAGQLPEAHGLLEAAALTNASSVEAAALAGYLAWEHGDAEQARAYAARARQAARVVAPARGVLGEGDRRAASGSAQGPPRPLESPMGRMLFGDALSAFHGPDATPDPVGIWRGIQRVRREVLRRSRNEAPSGRPA